MLKYNDIIIKLTDEQKIRILTGVGNISGNDMKLLGVPSLKVGNMKDYCTDQYPHAASLAHSWNKTLWENVANAKIVEMSKDDVNLFVAPGAKIKLSPYRKEITEDPYLASMISGAYMRATSEFGIVAGASKYYVAEADVAWMDKLPNDRILQEYIVKPYVDASQMSGIDTVITDARVPNEAYKDSGRYIQEAIFENASFLVCEHATEAHTVEYISRGIICLEASANALNSALVRYRKLKALSEQDENRDTAILKEELESAKAISDESIDCALDKVLEFVFECVNNKRSALIVSNVSEELALDATLESTVLLKNNNNTLPLAKEISVGIIGDIAFSTAFGEELANTCKRNFEDAGIKCSGVSRGYDLSDINNDEYVSQALNVCFNSDVILFFCGAGRQEERNIHKTQKLTLPPNQLHLADKISKLGKPVVAIMMSDHAPDIEFSDCFDAVVLTPSEVKCSAQALTNILLGEYSPTGKLAYTLYSETEKAFLRAQIYMDRYGMKTGPFIGYRYYDTDGVSVGYPFGHGLSYTEFKYSKLTVEEDQISFTLKNVGKVKSTETVQIYIGKNDSSILRPKKELCGFEKIELEPLEEKRITLKIDPTKVYYRGEYVVEKGSYTVYVGASVSDIRLEGKCAFDGISLESDKAQKADYLQSCCNILEGNYTLEAKYSFMKKLSKNMFIGVGALILAVSIAIFNSATYILSTFLGVIAAILGICAVAFLVVDMVEKSKQHADEREKIDKENMAYFEGAEKISVLSTEKMFKDAFDVENTDNTEEKSAEDYDINIDADYAQYIKPNFRISNAVAELNKFLAERGVKLNKGVAENLLSSLVTSRLMIFKGLSAEEFNSFILLLSEYFGTAACVDIANSSSERSVFFSTDEQGYQKKTNILQALQNAGNSHEKIQLAAIDGVTENDICAWTDPFKKYIRISKKRNDIAIFDNNGKNLGYSIGHNLWIVMRLADGQAFDTLPNSVIKNAAVVEISYLKCPVQEELSSYQSFTSYHADYILSKESGNKDVAEEIWKKVDKLEKYAQKYADYSIGNKLWLDIEKQMDILLACGMELNDALDAALAVRLLPSVVIALKDNLDKEDRTVLQTLEHILGAENIQYSKAFIVGAANSNTYVAPSEDQSGEESVEKE